MGTLEDVEGKVSYEATRLFHHVWLSEGQPLARTDPAGFSPKAHGSKGGVAGFLLCWPSWGIYSTMLTRHGFDHGAGRAKV